MNDYLMDQVLAQQSEQVKTFLLRTALVDRFCLPLCEILLHGTGSRATELLSQVKQANLLLVPLDDEQTWFRYHFIFHEWLAKQAVMQLGKEQVARLHRRASQWFATNVFYEEALRHACAGGHFDQAAT